MDAATRGGVEKLESDIAVFGSCDKVHVDNRVLGRLCASRAMELIDIKIVCYAPKHISVLVLEIYSVTSINDAS